MISIDLRGKVALITGGTKGIGLSAALSLGRAGAKIYVTSKWGSADLEEVGKLFESEGIPAPTHLEGDASVHEDTVKVLDTIRSQEERIHFFINNVGFAQKTPTLKDYQKRSLLKTLEYSSWPLVEYTREIQERFQAFPTHIIAISSDGPSHYYPGYDYVAASKSLLETLSHYLAVHVMNESCRVNVVRFGPVPTDSFEAFFGKEALPAIQQHIPANRILNLDQCGSSILALCSGLLDGIHGQIVNIDHGVPFLDNSLVKFFR